MENSRAKFKEAFPDEHSLIVALHSRHLEHALEGADIAIKNGAHGVALVTHAISPNSGLAFSMRIKEQFPYHKVLLNILQRDPYNFRDKSMQRDPKRIMESVQHTEIDGIWTDKSMIKGIDNIRDEEKYGDYAEKTLQWQQENGRNKLYFGGLDFKHQKHLSQEEYPFAVEQAKKYLDVITTSGPATGHSADPEKVKMIKSLAGEHPVGLASGVTAENIHEYIQNTDISIVASGISSDYRNLDPEKVSELAKIIEQYNRKMSRKHFESKILQKYGVQSARELYNHLIQKNIINIGMRPNQSEIEKKLSNLYPSPFVLDGVEYASVEAFRMSIKYPENDPRRTEIRELSGIKAKFAGRDARHYKSIHYQGEEIKVGSAQHHAVLKRALRAKLEQNPDILQTLLDTGEKPFVHIVFTRHEGDDKRILHDSKSIPGEKFAQLYSELRDELRNR